VCLSPCLCWLRATFDFRKEDPTKLLAENLRRIFQERGRDFFDQNGGDIVQDGVLVAKRPETEKDEDTTEPNEDPDAPPKIMTTEELLKLRLELLPHLQ
jgi:mediator of RNA polymerase II transcription subunit 17, fungi type